MQRYKLKKIKLGLKKTIFGINSEKDGFSGKNKNLSTYHGLINYSLQLPAWTPLSYN
jgi:hypothetical protein